MGCHTWFYRPVTEDEFLFFKQNAVGDACRLWNIVLEEDYLTDHERTCEIEKVRKSVESNADYWWKNGYGAQLPDGRYERIEAINGRLYLSLTDSVNPIFPELKRYHDVFRVQNYPIKIIRSRHELRKFLGKRYFQLEEWQLDAVYGPQRPPFRFRTAALRSKTAAS